MVETAQPPTGSLKSEFSALTVSIQEAAEAGKF